MTERIWMVLRGGSWSDHLLALCASFRNGHGPDLWNDTYGFRLVIEEKEG